MNDDLLTIRDVAALTGATPMTIYNWRKKRTDKTSLPCVQQRVGAGVRRRVFFKREVFVKWAKRNDVSLVPAEARKLKMKVIQQ